MPDVRHLRTQWSTLGLRGMATIAARNRLGRRLGTYDVCRPLVENARGLEIGGPSAIFARNGPLPLYPHLARLDNCDVVLRGDAADQPFHYDPSRPPGAWFVRDGAALDAFGAGSYDVLLSSHAIEHIANPLRALAEWTRIVRDGGILVLVAPHVENTFDHRRPVTTLRHLEDDLDRSTPESDETHVSEFIALCDLDRLPERISRKTFEQRTLNYPENRSVHHHVFDTDLVVRMLDRVGLRLLAVEPALPFHIVAVGVVDRDPPGNDAFLAPDAPWRRESVFRRDRAGAP